MRRALLLLAALVAGTSAQAQEEDPEMVLQRCVWSCLANSKGADDPAYRACVDAVCVPAAGEQSAASAQPAPPPGAPAVLPDAIREFADENIRFCKEVGGTPNFSGIDMPGAGRAADGTPPFITEVDLNADGRPDYVTDLAGLECVNAWSLFCGSAGCPVTVWVGSAAGHEVAWGGSAQAWRLDGRDVVLSLHGQLCTPPRVGADGCEEVVRLGAAPDPGTDAGPEAGGVASAALAPEALAPGASPRPAARPADGAAAAFPAPAPEAPQPPSAAAPAAPPPDSPSLPSLMGEPAAGWQYAQTADFSGWYAGTKDADTGARLDWLCGKGRPSLLALSPYAGNGRIAIDVDGRVQDFAVTTENGVAYAPISIGDPLFLHIASGRMLTISDDAGGPIGRFSMDGAPLAIGQAEGRCRV
ncbi:hypothetical protein ACRDNQ_13750 [Palleronia sp. KMU-117]|uniref:hypothetical protein n=1 Tax=Palleronia sp. KMU-117 TaxID=3434108 RepID=UPI003D70D00A